MWVEPDIRDNIVDYVNDMKARTGLDKRKLVRWLGIQRSRYYDWEKRTGEPNHHNGTLRRFFWLMPEEKQAIIDYCREQVDEGYRRLTYMMLDADVAAVSPTTTYRILKEADLINRWPKKSKTTGKGFDQPGRPHEHWHVDIAYVNILGTVFFLITVLDGASRYAVHHELRTHMQEYDVQLTIQRAQEKFPHARPRIISDNGPQFISRDFKEYMRLSGFTHVRTSPYHPQSNGKLERYHGTIKREEIRRQSYLSLEDARKHIGEFVEYYNTQRLHSALYYLTPEDVLKGRMQERLAERQLKLDNARARRQERYTARRMAS